MEGEINRTKPFGDRSTVCAQKGGPEWGGDDDDGGVHSVDAIVLCCESDPETREASRSTAFALWLLGAGAPVEEALLLFTRRSNTVHLVTRSENLGLTTVARPSQFSLCTLCRAPVVQGLGDERARRL